MIVKFKECYYVWYGPHVELSEFTRASYTAHDWKLKITRVLKDKFKSIVFSPEVPDNFQFKDKADEAAFLLWSSDGIEI
jgi:hypothetical protein